MSRKFIISMVSALLLGSTFSLYSKEGDLSFEAEELTEVKNITIEDEIDQIIEEIRSIPQVPYERKEAVKEVQPYSRVISPYEVSQTLIPATLRDKKMSLEFDDAFLEDVIQTIGDTAGINVVLNPMLKERKVDIHLKDVPIGEALMLLYNAYDLGSFQVGNSLYVTTRDTIQKETLVTKIIKLKNVSVAEAENLIKNMVEILNKSEETNTLVVVGNPEDIGKVEEIVRSVDKPQPQVILEAKIIEISKDAQKELGINWSDTITVGFQETKRKKTIDDPVPFQASAFRIFRFARNAVTFNAIISLLETQNKAKILSSPKITTLNNKTAEIFVGQEIPYTVTEVSGGVASTEIRFIEPGIRLKITPSIIEKEFVVIKVEPEVSSETGTFESEAGNFPIVTTRQAVAYVRVKNNQPFIMGGLLQKEDVKDIAKVPFLGDIPLLGMFFTYKKDAPYESELIISVIPTIIHGDL